MARLIETQSTQMTRWREKKERDYTRKQSPIQWRGGGNWNKWTQWEIYFFWQMELENDANVPLEIEKIRIPPSPSPPPPPPPPLPPPGRPPPVFHQLKQPNSKQQKPEMPKKMSLKEPLWSIGLFNFLIDVKPPPSQYLTVSNIHNQRVILGFQQPEFLCSIHENWIFPRGVKRWAAATAFFRVQVGDVITAAVVALIRKSTIGRLLNCFCFVWLLVSRFAFSMARHQLRQVMLSVRALLRACAYVCFRVTLLNGSHFMLMISFYERPS